jgi:hypothetical protein
MEAKMDAATRGLLIGMVIGDGCISATKVPTKTTGYYVNTILQIWHSVAQLDYCQYKLELLKSLLGIKSLMNFRDCTLSNGKTYRLCGFGTSNPYFKQLRKWLYPNGKKQFTSEVLNMLSPQGIALWYMDDGYGRGRRNKDGWISAATTSIATMCSRQEVEYVRDYFLEAHGIAFNTRFRKGSKEDRGWFIEGGTAVSKKFAELVSPHIIPSMLYKVAHVADLHLHECQTPKPFKCKGCGSEILENQTRGCRNCNDRRLYYANLEESRKANRLRMRRWREAKNMAGDEIVQPNRNE